jgi:solute carrier family 25 (mitochondrial thiamine pyrophosphate transporter), member 19
VWGFSCSYFRFTHIFNTEPILFDSTMERSGDTKHETHSALDQFKQALAGGASGAVTRFFCQPLDVLKIRFQLQVEPIWHQQNTSKYKSVSQAVVLMLKEEGIPSFWKGHNPAQLLSICYGISQFWCYEQFNIYAKHSDYLSQAHGTRHFLCGGLAGACGMIVAAPLDVVRTRLVAQDNSKGYRNSTQGIRTIYRHEGVRGLFRGIGPSLLQVAPLTGAQFYFYNLFGDMLKQMLEMKATE